MVAQRIGLRSKTNLTFLVILFTYQIENVMCNEACNKDDDTNCETKLQNGNPTDDSFGFNKYKQNDRLELMETVKVGHVQSVELSSGQTVDIQTTSLKPPIFEIPNFLSPEECDHFIAVAKTEGLEKSGTVSDVIHQKGINLLDVNQDQRLSMHEMMLTLEDSYDMFLTEDDIREMYGSLKIDNNNDEFITPEEISQINADKLTEYLTALAKKQPIKRSRYSRQVWLFPDSSDDKIFKDVQKRVQEVTNLPEVMIKKSDFQVVTYGVGGHYNAHQDSSELSKQPCCTRTRSKECRICRFMTILFYLNDVEEGGGTAFPLAGNETYDEHKFRHSHHMNLQRYCDVARHIVAPSRGKAVVWYNHVIDPVTGWVGDLDQYTWHGGCPVTRGRKWIANFWIKYTDDKQRYLRDEL